MMRKNPKIEIDNSDDVFWTDFITVSHVPNQIAIDFRQTTPRFNPVSGQEQTLVVKHRVILMSPELAKSFLNTLKANIERYEKKFGKIKTEQMKKSKKATRKDDLSYVG